MLEASMSNLSTIAFAETFHHVSTQVNLYFAIFIFVFDMISNFLNCLVLTRPILRRNPCAFLFLVSSIANIVSITFGLGKRILAVWSVQLSDTNAFMCKARAFILLVSRTAGFWLIAFATIDRWLSSCSQYRRRQMSSLRNSRRGTVIIIGLSSLLYCQAIYCYDVNIASAPLRCYSRTVQCRWLIDLTYALITILCPLSIMFVVGLMTIANVRRRYSMSPSKRQLFVVGNPRRGRTRLANGRRQRRRKKIDRYLCHVLLVQILFLTVLTLPHVIVKFYKTLTIHQTKSPLNLTIDHFIYNLVPLLTYLSNGMSFYIYTLSGGSVFRTALLSLFRRLSH